MGKILNQPVTAFIHSPQLEAYSYPPDCPFNISRAAKLKKILDSMGLLSKSNTIEIPPGLVDKKILKKFHTARYLDVLKAAARGDIDVEALHMGLGTGDCPIFRDMYDCSAAACAASLTGVELILSGKAQAAFNPSGGLHHAGPERSAGFCYLNDVALACIRLTEAGKKVLYLDIDVHHGDGVADFFYERNDVMTISLHQNGRTLFPGTGFEDEIGTGPGRGYCINVPLPIGTYDAAYMLVFESIVLPLIKSYEPDVFVFELGADTLASDPLAQLQLTNNTYVDIIEHLLNFKKPILMTGGGGYNIENTVRAWALAFSVLCGADGQSNDAHLGLGGVMLESTDWLGGLRDRELPVTLQQQETVLPVIETTIKALMSNLSDYHKL